MAGILTADVVRDGLRGATNRVSVSLAESGDRPELEARLREVMSLLVEASPKTVVLEQVASKTAYGNLRSTVALFFRLSARFGMRLVKRIAQTFG